MKAFQSWLRSLGKQETSQHRELSARFISDEKNVSVARCASLTKKRSNLLRYFKPLLLWSILRKWNSRESSCALNLAALLANESSTLPNYECHYSVRQYHVYFAAIRIILINLR